jgi:hypothetical protein
MLCVPAQERQTVGDAVPQGLGRPVSRVERQTRICLTSRPVEDKAFASERAVIIENYPVERGEQMTKAGSVDNVTD